MKGHTYSKRRPFESLTVSHHLTSAYINEYASKLNSEKSIKPHRQGGGQHFVSIAPRGKVYLKMLITLS